MFSHGPALIFGRYQQAFLASQIAGAGGSYWIGLGNGGTYSSQNWVTTESLDYTAWSANYTTANNTGTPLIPFLAGPSVDRCFKYIKSCSNLSIFAKISRYI